MKSWDPKFFKERLNTFLNNTETEHSMATFGIDIPETHIRVFGEGTSKEQALDQLIEALANNASVTDAGAFRTAVLAREAQGSTAMGGGIAIPHVRHDSVSRPALAVGISAPGVPFGANDGSPAHIIVLFAVPTAQDKVYLNLLAQTMLALRDKTLFAQLSTCKTAADACGLLAR